MPDEDPGLDRPQILKVGVVNITPGPDQEESATHERLLLEALLDPQDGAATQTLRRQDLRIQREFQILLVLEGG